MNVLQEPVWNCKVWLFRAIGASNGALKIWGAPAEQGMKGRATMEAVGTLILILFFGCVLLSCFGAIHSGGFLAAIEHRGALPADQVSGFPQQLRRDGEQAGLQDY